MKMHRIIQIAAMISLVAILASCEYDFIKPEPAPPVPEPTDTISFAMDVAPIWNNNNCTNCHKPGGISQLDLTAANAYSSLTSKGLYNTAVPESSKIYTFPYPETGEHNYKYANTSEAEIILLWIAQGAANN